MRRARRRRLRGVDLDEGDPDGSSASATTSPPGIDGEAVAVGLRARGPRSPHASPSAPARGSRRRSRWRGRGAGRASGPRPVGTVKAEGTAITLGAGLGEVAVEMREAQVVADRHAEPDARRLGDHRLIAGPVGGGLAVALARRRRRRRTCGSCRSGRGSRPSGPIRNERLTKRPSGRLALQAERADRAARPRARRRPPRGGRASGPPPRGRAPAPAAPGSLRRCWCIPASATSVAPPAAASRTSASVAARLARRVVARAELDEGGPHATAAQSSASSRVELAGPVERVDVVEAADVLAADEDLRHRPAPRRRAATISARRSGGGGDVDLLEGDALRREEPLGRRGSSRRRGSYRS